MKYHFKCVMCNGSLHLDEVTRYVCDTCGREYPIINNIPILIARYKPALLSIERYIEDELTKFNDLQALLSKLDNANHRDIDIHRMLTGMERNLRLMKRHCKPISDFLAGQKLHLSNIDWFFANDPGRSFHYMLRYFYQDWYGTRQFTQVKKLVTQTIATHCDDTESIVVLGCGACGLLYHLANSFSESYGVDLAIPTLMTAQQFLNGEAISFYMESGEWKEIHLDAQTKTISPINLVAGNVMRLPFQDASISTIVTQYMMDLDSNHPQYLTTEIHRVLKPGGIWVNFSIPFNVPGDVFELGPIKLNKLPIFFKQFGFELIDSEQQRFKPWNFEDITETGERPDHEVHFYVAKKTSQPTRNQKLYIPFINYFSKNNDYLLDYTPLTVEGRTLAVINKSEFRNGAVHQSKALSVTLSKFNEKYFPIDDEKATFIEKFFTLINGERSLRDIYNLAFENDIKLTEDEFIEFFHALSIFYYLIYFQEVESD